jgi:hypothetical protein
VVSIDESTVVGHVDALFFGRGSAPGAAGDRRRRPRARIPVAAAHHLGTDAVTVPRLCRQWLNPTSIPAGSRPAPPDELLLTAVDEAGTVLAVSNRARPGTAPSAVRVHWGVLGIGGTTHTISGAAPQRAPS